MDKFLIDETELESYRDYLKHAFANQAALLREQHFDRPDWQQTIDSLKNGKPAHIADLHALTIEHLKDLANRIANENTDMFKFFGMKILTQELPNQNMKKVTVISSLN